MAQLRLIRRGAVFVAALWSLFMSLPAHALVLNCPLGRATVITVNGIWVEDTPADARYSRDYLQATLAKDLPTAHYRRLVFDYLYNPTHGAADVVESLVFGLRSNYTQVLRWLNGLDPIPTVLQSKIDAVLYDPSRYTEDVDLQTIREHVDGYYSCLGFGRIGEIVVPHSEGNFYVNAAVADPRIRSWLDSEVRVVSVANPSICVGLSCWPNLPSTARYTTKSTDIIITQIAPALGLFPLQPNVPSLPYLGDPSGHKFVDSYLRADTTSRSKIVADIDAAADELFAKVSTKTELVITGTVTGVSGTSVLDQHLGSPYPVGSQFTARVRFDPTAPDRETGDSGYYGDYSIISSSIQMGANTFDLVPDVTLGFPNTRYVVSGSAPGSPFAYSELGLQINGTACGTCSGFARLYFLLSGAPATYYTSDQFPTTSPDLTQFPTQQLAFSVCTDMQATQCGTVAASIESISIVVGSSP